MRKVFRTAIPLSFVVATLGCAAAEDPVSETGSTVESGLVPPGENLLGVWQLLESSSETAKVEDAWVEVTPTHWVFAAEGRLRSTPTS